MKSTKKQIISGLMITYRVLFILFMLVSIVLPLTPVRVDVKQMAEDIWKNRIEYFNNNPADISTDITTYIRFNEIKAAGDRYWVGGAGSWNQTVHWSNSDGGLGGYSVPDATVNAHFTSLSDNSTGSYAVSLNVAAHCADFIADNPTGGVLTVGPTGGTSLEIAGDFQLAVGVLWTGANSITFSATAVSTITTNGVVFAGGGSSNTWIFDGAGGYWVFQDNLTKTTGTGSGFTITTGTVNTNNFTMEVGTNAISIAAGGALVTGSSVINGGTWSFNSGATINSGTSTINLSSGGASVFLGGGKTYSTVNITNAGGTVATSLTGANTFTNLSITGGNLASAEIDMGANQVITGTLTINGYSNSKKLKVFSDTLHTQRTLTAAAVSVSNTSFRDIVGAGAGSWNFSARTDVGNCYGNSGITFPAATTVYASQIPGNVNWTEANNWASASGGTPGSGRIPLPQDTAIFDEHSMAINGIIVTFDDYSSVSSINTTLVTKNPQFGATNAYIYGSVDLGTCLWTITSGTYLYGQKAMTLSGNFTDGSGNLYIDAQTGSFAQSGNIIVEGTIYLTSGVWETNDYSVTAEIFNSATTTYSRALWMDNSTFYLTATTAVTKWNVATLNMNIDCITSTINMTSTTTSTNTFAGGGKTYYRLVIGGSGNYTTAFADSNTFHTITVDRTENWKTVSGSFTETLSYLRIPIYGVNKVTINGTDFTKTAGVVVSDYLTIQNSAAGGGADYYAGSHSTNVSGNSGWLFLDYPFSFPTATTLNATSVTYTQAQLNGTLTNIGLFDDVYGYFQYDTTGTFTSPHSTSLQSLTANGNYSINATGLSSNTTYHYRAVINYNDLDYSFGGDKTFFTGATDPGFIPSGAMVTTLPANPVGENTATLNGALNSMGGATSAVCYFEWGTDSYYGQETTQMGYISTGIFSANLTHLTPNTTYYFRAKAVFGEAVYDGDGLSFTTSGAAGASTIIQIRNAKMFQNYVTTGDMLLVVQTANYYSYLYPNQDIREHFTVQLVGTNNSTILGESPAANWGLRPASIYFNPTVVTNNLTYGSTYYVKMLGDARAGNPVATYRLVATTSDNTDWMGTDMVSLDNWCRSRAREMGLDDAGYMGYYLTNPTDRNAQINEAGISYFVTGIPYIDEKRPYLFTTAPHKATINLGTAVPYWDKSDADTAGWRYYVGSNLAADIDVMAVPLGVNGKDLMAGIFIMMMLGCVMFVVSGTGGFGALGAGLIALPLLWLGVWFRAVPMSILAIIIIFFGLFAIRQFVIKTL